MHVPRSSTPVGRERSADFRAHDVAFRTLKNVGPTKIPVSRSSMTRPVHTLSTLRPRGHPVGRKTRFRLPQPSLAGRDWLPAGFHYEVSSGLLIPPRPGLAWRTQTTWAYTLPLHEVVLLRTLRCSRRESLLVGTYGTRAYNPRPMSTEPGESASQSCSICVRGSLGTDGLKCRCTFTRFGTQPRTRVSHSH